MIELEKCKMHINAPDVIRYFTVSRRPCQKIKRVQTSYGQCITAFHMELKIAAFLTWLTPHISAVLPSKSPPIVASVYLCIISTW